MEAQARLGYGFDLQNKVLEAFKADINPIPVPFSYRFSLVLVTLVMVMLPLLYVALVIACGYGLVYYYLHYGDFFGNVHSGRAHLFLLLAPGIVGGISLLFMIKPLFARSSEAYEETWLDPKNEPLLFAFIERLTTAVGAPFPKVISVDQQVNASAGFHNGWRGFFKNELKLTLGLPLVAGLSAEQLAGVLAHEFGHFAQSAGMRLTYIVRSINYWFVRVVYERDEWDERLEQWREESESVFAFVFMLAAGCVWLTRRILQGLMMLGHAVSSLMMRQMEFDADRYEASLVGADIFESTARELNYLSWSHHTAENEQQSFFQTGKLCGDLSALALFHRTTMESTVRVKLDEHLEKGDTSWDSSHPCDRDRIANARKIATDPVFHLQMPAHTLFRDFKATSTVATAAHYQTLLDGELDTAMLRPVEELKQHMVRQKAATLALSTYFGALVNPYRAPLVTAEKTQVTNAAETTQILTHLRTLQAANATTLFKDIKKLNRLRDGWFKQSQAALLAEVGIPFKTASYKVPTENTEDIEAAIAKTEQQLAEWEDGLQQKEAIAAKRLVLALDLLARPQITARIPDGPELAAETAPIRTAYHALSAGNENLLDIRRKQAELVGLFEVFEDREENETLRDRLVYHGRILSARLEDYLKPLKQVPLPFDHADKNMNLADYLLNGRPDRENPAQCYQASSTLVNNALTMRNNLLGHLAMAAEAVETVFGLEPTPAPDHDESEIWNTHF